MTLDLPPFFRLSKHYIEFRNQRDPGCVVAFSTRRGGVSVEPFNSLNMSADQGDSELNVSRNLKILCDSIFAPPETILGTRQVHGDKVVVYRSPPEGAQSADASITNTPGLFVSVKTADCLPVLLHDHGKNVSAAVHAGWAGSSKRICSKTIKRMQAEFGCEAEDIVGILGPCIGPCCYEVDERVIGPMQSAFSHWQSFIKPLSVWRSQGLDADGLSGNRPENESMRLDLAGANRSDLLSAGLLPGNIHNVGLCGCCQEELFFSHRRDKGVTGRHIALVGRLAR